MATEPKWKGWTIRELIDGGADRADSLTVCALLLERIEKLEAKVAKMDKVLRDLADAGSNTYKDDIPY